MRFASEPPGARANRNGEPNREPEIRAYVVRDATINNANPISEAAASSTAQQFASSGGVRARSTQVRGNNGSVS